MANGGSIKTQKNSELYLNCTNHSVAFKRWNFEKLQLLPTQRNREWEVGSFQTSPWNDSHGLSRLTILWDPRESTF